MAILSDKSIKELGDILVRPFKATNVQPSSYELHLDGEINREVIVPPEDGKTPRPVRRGEKPWQVFHGDSFVINPGEFILGVTKERVNVLPNMVGQVWGKSSWGRMGLMIHVTAGWVDAGFAGQIVLEIVNLSHQPIELRAGDAIAQIAFARMDSEAQYPYGHKELNSHYQNQQGVVPARAE